MARKTSTPSFRSSGSPSRDLFLAGVGAVSLGRKQALRSYQRAIDGLYGLRSQAQTATREIESKARKLRKQLDARIAPVQKKAQALAGEARTQAAQRLSPVLARFGVARKPVKRAPRRRPAAKRVRKSA